MDLLNNDIQIHSKLYLALISMKNFGGVLQRELKTLNDKRCNGRRLYENKRGSDNNRRI
jgi:hypothetical protein